MPTNIMWCSFDDKFFHYGIRMYRSFHRFNPTVPMFFGDFGSLDDQHKQQLVDDGITILPRTGDVPVPRHLNIVDLLGIEYLDQVKWDAALWLDADSIIGGDITEIFSHPEEMICIPDREARGIIKDRYSFGVWSTRTRRILVDFYELLRANHNLVAESPSMNKIVRAGYRHHGLDGDLYNFGRDDLVKLRYRDHALEYDLAGKTIRPKVVAYSRLGDGSRCVNPEIDRFYDHEVTAAETPARAQ